MYICLTEVGSWWLCGILICSAATQSAQIAMLMKDVRRTIHLPDSEPVLLQVPRWQRRIHLKSYSLIIVENSYPVFGWMGGSGTAAYVMSTQSVSPSHPKCPCLASRALNPFSWPSLIGSSTCTWPSSKNTKILEVCQCLQFSIAGSQNGFGLVFVSPVDEFWSSLASDSGMVSWSTNHLTANTGTARIEANHKINRSAQRVPTS